MALSAQQEPGAALESMQRLPGWRKLSGTSTIHSADSSSSIIPPKDFIIDEYQVIEAKSIGADVILLIAACLNPEQVSTLASLARSLGLEVLLEIHHEGELKNINENIDLIGVNNRDLATFETSIETSKALSEMIPSEFVKITESGISDPGVVMDLLDYGYKGFLIGENFMRHGQPEKACSKFIDQLKILKTTKELKSS